MLDRGGVRSKEHPLGHKFNDVAWFYSTHPSRALKVWLSELRGFFFSLSFRYVISRRMLDSVAFCQRQTGASHDQRLVTKGGQLKLLPPRLPPLNAPPTHHSPSPHCPCSVACYSFLTAQSACIFKCTLFHY